MSGTDHGAFRLFVTMSHVHPCNKRVCAPSKERLFTLQHLKRFGIWPKDVRYELRSPP